MRTSELIAKLQLQMAKRGDGLVMIDVHGQFKPVTHVDSVTMRDPEGDYTVTFVNFDGKRG